MISVCKMISGTATASIAAVLLVACSSMEDKPAPTPAPAPAPAAASARTEATKGEAAKREAEKTAKTKAVNVEGVISAVGQRTITFQVERKGKVREEVVGVDDKTNIEKSGNKVKLRDLEATDKGMINYEPNAYTPAIAIKITGKGKIRKAGGDD